MRRQTLNEETVKRIFKAHSIFVLILTTGAVFRIATEVDDGNTIMFAMVLAIGVIIAASLFNKMIIDLFNNINTRWTIINYCVPGILPGVFLLVFKIPVEVFDVFLLVVLMITADLLMYSLIEKANRTHNR